MKFSENDLVDYNSLWASRFYHNYIQKAVESAIKEVDNSLLNELKEDIIEYYRKRVYIKCYIPDIKKAFNALVDTLVDNMENYEIITLDQYMQDPDVPEWMEDFYSPDDSEETWSSYAWYYYNKELAAFNAEYLVLADNKDNWVIYDEI